MAVSTVTCSSYVSAAKTCARRRNVTQWSAGQTVQVLVQVRTGQNLQDQQLLYIMHGHRRDLSEFFMI